MPHCSKSVIKIVCIKIRVVCNGQPGGDYTYILDTLGPFVGFVRLWAECLIVRPCTMTIVALTFAKYAVKLFFPECQPPDESVRLLAAACICKFQESSSGPSCNPGLRQTNARGLGPSFENVNKCRLLWHSQYVIIPVYFLIYERIKNVRAC